MACSHHTPAPVEEQSSGPEKRQLDQEGRYRIKSGDTLYAIAFNFDVDVRNLARWNEISSPYIIYPGQQLRLTAPPSAKRRPATSSDVKITALKPPAKTTTKNTTVNTSKDTPTVINKTTTKTITEAAPKAVSSKPAVTTAEVKSTSTGKQKVSATAAVPKNAPDPKSWKWPTNGRVLRGYVAADPARNGLDITGKEGQDIRASSGGQVVYSGNGLIGYGELIIIKHSERMLSAYAHNKVRLVREGEQVKSGQKIAEMGRNAANEQLLHFEIRVRGKPVNPLRYLPKK